jgi:hypothetical protein
MEPWLRTLNSAIPMAVHQGRPGSPGRTGPSVWLCQSPSSPSVQVFRPGLCDHSIGPRSVGDRTGPTVEKTAGFWPCRLILSEPLNSLLRFLNQVTVCHPGQIQGLLWVCVLCLSQAAGHRHGRKSRNPVLTQQYCFLQKHSSQTPELRCYSHELLDDLVESHRPFCPQRSGCTLHLQCHTIPVLDISVLILTEEALLCFAALVKELK